MLEFKEVELSDRDVIIKYLEKADYKGSEYSFGNNFIWQCANKIEFTLLDGFYCLKSNWKSSDIYTFPAGKGDIKSVIEKLMADSFEKEKKFKLRGITKENVTLLEEIFPEKFEFIENRDEFDYIYSAEKLINLPGKKMHSKRNHIARFKENNWTYENINENNLNECVQMSRDWCKKYFCNEDQSLVHEKCAIKKAFENFFVLDFKGGVLKIDGEVVAFTIGEKLSSDTFIVHIEKAYHEIQGAYPMINQQFVINNCKEFVYVNREEDLGEEGLRKAKLSYKPEILLEKYTATLK